MTTEAGPRGNRTSQSSNSSRTQASFSNSKLSGSVARRSADHSPSRCSTSSRVSQQSQSSRTSVGRQQSQASWASQTSRTSRGQQRASQDRPRQAKVPSRSASESGLRPPKTHLGCSGRTTHVSQESARSWRRSDVRDPVNSSYRTDFVFKPAKRAGGSCIRSSSAASTASTTTVTGSGRGGFQLVEGYGGHRPKAETNLRKYGKTFGQPQDGLRTSNSAYGTSQSGKVSDETKSKSIAMVKHFEAWRPFALRLQQLQLE